MADAAAELAMASKVRGSLEAWAAAVRAKDLRRLMAHYAEAVRVFDLAPPLERQGRAAMERSLADWFTTFAGPIGYELRDLQIEGAGGFAMARGLLWISGARTDGTMTDVWVRTTLALRRDGGRWRIVHEHSSMPFHMDGSYRAAIELRHRPAAAPEARPEAADRAGGAIA
jgi:PhnB protein